MHDLVLVAVGYGTEELLHDFGGLVLVETAGLNNFIKQLASSAQLCDDVKVRRVLVELVDLEDVRVVQGRQDINLIDESLLLLLVRLRLVEDLDGAVLT